MRYILFLLTMLTTFAALADTLVLRNGSEIECTIDLITSSHISYTLPGQTVRRQMATKDVFMARYANGTQELFNNSTDNTKQELVGYGAHASFNEFFPISLPISINTDYSDLPPASRQYKLLDLYEERGVRGIVVEVTDDGRHGKIMSLKHHYSGAFKKVPKEVCLGSGDFVNGEYNTQVWRQAVNKLGLTGDYYPKVLSWLDELGSGWYIPSYGELLKFFEQLHLDVDKSELKRLNNIIKQAGGNKFTGYVYLTSSSEFKLRNAQDYRFAEVRYTLGKKYGFLDAPPSPGDEDVGYDSGIGKRKDGVFRAFRRF